MRFTVAPWAAKRDDWRERQRQVKCLSVVTLAGTCRAEFSRRFSRPRRRFGVDLLGGPGDYLAGVRQGTYLKPALEAKRTVTALIWATLHHPHRQLCSGLIPM